MIKSLKLILFITICFTQQLISQDEEAFFIKDIYEYTLSDGICDQWLSFLSDSIGGRLAGSQNALDAVDYTLNELKKIDIVDTVYKQECIVPKWERGEKEVVKIFYDNEEMELNALALGNSKGTGENGLTGEIIEVFGLDTLNMLGREKLEGKIVFFNRPMNPKRINTGYAYGEAVDQRVHGASRASLYGAKAVLVRSVTTQSDDLPHTGVQTYQEDVEPIPSLAISTNDANKLGVLLDSKKVMGYIRNTSQILPPTTSYNVVAEIRGQSKPDEIILVGGHLDSWDVGGGAHDDGSGCVHSMQVIHTLSNLNYKPERTLRCVLFMNEENGLGGALAYAKESNRKGEFHLAAIESDSGGFTPRGFTCTGEPSVLPKYLANLQKFDVFLDPYDLYLKPGGGGADINPLKSQKGLLIGFKPDGQRYFDFHHTEADVFKNVNVRELKLGAASITSLVYLIDQRGL
ncbi:MAG: M28 family peptidase [Saprospiraceae bacterium]|nr:M28 family peptidase [Bacteroidia bacterium]NNE16551.1 M28 family peptidase [Saprospiraceae bacterium]NNL91446.1 M28 family peptidase [Saprospiraceae bacterium]